jgi:A/G-specific adenine glycosylase
MAASHLSSLLATWLSRRQRDLPWRRSGPSGQREAYATWIAEVMLHQTRVEVAGPYWERFMARFPDVRALAAAPETEVLRAWAGLGYYRRARMLHAAATEVVRERGGCLPGSAAAWRELPGIGPYTAAAIAAQAHGEAVAAVDGNVKRVAARMLALSLPLSSRALHLAADEWAGELVRAAPAPGVIVEALMELGATVCLPRAPRCAECPLADFCRARADGNVERFPAAAARIEWRDLELLGFVAARGEGLLLRERKEGWNPGLWEPPTLLAQPKQKAAGAWRSLDCGTARDLVEIGEVRHVITRHRIRVRVFEAAGWRGGPRAVREDAVGLTGLAKKMIRLREAARARA